MEGSPKNNNPKLITKTCIPEPKVSNLFIEKSGRCDDLDVGCRLWFQEGVL